MRSVTGSKLTDSLFWLIIVGVLVYAVSLGSKLEAQLNIARHDARMCQEVLVHTCSGETYACEYLQGE